LSYSRLKGAIAPGEFLQFGSITEFKEIDPREGFSVRNFQIQAAKTAMVSDIIVYGEDEDEVQKLAADIAMAQRAWRDSHKASGHDIPLYNTFVCTSPFKEFETRHPEIVIANSRGELTGNVMDFFHQERIEMATMTKASEIARNVWLGPTPDSSIDPSLLPGEEAFDLFIECSDLGRLNSQSLKDAVLEFDKGSEAGAYVEFPSSGSIMPPSWSFSEADEILEICRWIYYLASGVRPTEDVESSPGVEGDSPMPDPLPVMNRPRKVLIHCTDGYTESSMLALAYYIYAHGVTVSEAWLQMHVDKRRNFFAYPSDVALLNAIAPSLLAGSPAVPNPSTQDIVKRIQDEPAWLSLMDGSLPSRVLDYMYLGNLGHANNPELLRSLGIGQILSVGETATWRDGEAEKWGEDKVCIVQSVQDNGVDPLTGEFERCLAFIGEFGFLIPQTTMTEHD
jgi:dual specificity MAP kinase phosphatase